MTNYDTMAGRFDRRYALYGYDGVRDTVLEFLGPETPSTLEVGCGTGHWLAGMNGRTSTLAGVDPSAAMLVLARGAAPGAHLVRAGAEDLPWKDATFDRVVCVNALHHFSDRERFFVEARRVLRPGGGVLTIGKDPHAGRDEWWVYDYFPGMLTLDRARFAQVRTLRGEVARAGFAWAESREADHIDVRQSAADVLAEGREGLADRSLTSRLSALPEEEFASGFERLRTAEAEGEAAGNPLDLVADFRLFATIGWVA